MKKKGFMMHEPKILTMLYGVRIRPKGKKCKNV